MKRSGHWLVITLFVAAPMAGLLLVAGCEFSGLYESDNVKVQVGNTNAVTQSMWVEK